MPKKKAVSKEVSKVVKKEEALPVIPPEAARFERDTKNEAAFDALLKWLKTQGEVIVFGKPKVCFFCEKKAEMEFNTPITLDNQHGYDVLHMLKTWLCGKCWAARPSDEIIVVEIIQNKAKELLEEEHAGKSGHRKSTAKA